MSNYTVPFRIQNTRGPDIYISACATKSSPGEITYTFERKLDLLAGDFVKGPYSFVAGDDGSVSAIQVRLMP